MTQQIAHPIVITDYDAHWPELFALEKRAIEDALGPLIDGVTGIEHVGSTSVPGCAAKPIIDIMIGVCGAADALRCITPIVGLGYECVGEGGIPGRIYFRKGTPRSHHIHLVHDGSRFWEKHLSFRDRLRARPDLVEQYSALKRRLAVEHGGNRLTYTFAKTPFIEAALAYGVAIVAREAIVIREYDDEWPLYFELEKVAIMNALGPAAPEVAGIEHIGSTAVAGLDAKPVIDIALGVRDLVAAEPSVVPKMEAIGYTYERPRGREDDLYCSKGAPHTHHLHIIEHGGRQWREYLALRDALRADAGLARRYAALKRELAARHWDDPDRHAYAHAKSPFIRSVLAGPAATRP